MASITCGNCNQTHDSVRAVRLCYIRSDQPHNDTLGEYDRSLAEPDAAQARIDDIRVGRSTVTSRPTAGGPVTEDGMYRDASGAIYKVVHAVNGSGRLYAKRLVAERGAANGYFVYAPGAIRHLSTNDKMSLEDAKEFGKLYGFCVRCGRTLTDEGSIEAGIGPVCAAVWAGKW